MSNVETGIGLMIRKIVKEKIEIDSERLLKDLAQVRELYFGD